MTTFPRLSFLPSRFHGHGHAAGTYRMGAADDPHAVVDPRRAVRGVEGLRVVDCSVMPDVVRANTHLTAVTIVEKIAADLASTTTASKRINTRVSPGREPE